MNDTTIRITEHSDGLRSIDIILPKRPISATLEAFADGDALVPGDGQDALEALAQVAATLSTRCVLEDMLIAIDKLQSPKVIPHGPRFFKLAASGEILPPDADTWSAVLDNDAGLIWSAEDVGSGRLTHDAATKACADLSLCNRRDWRLPTRKELESLVDLARHEPAIDTAFFPTTKKAYYWTSSPCAWAPGRASWCVDFYGGGVGSYYHDNGAFVRAVRSASPAAGQ